MRHLSWDDIWSCLDTEGVDAPELLRDHIEKCTVCAHKLRLAREASVALAHVLRMDSPPPASSDTDANLLLTLSRATLDASVVPAQRRAIRIPLYSVFAATAAVIFISGIGIYLWHKGYSGPSGSLLGAASTDTRAASSALSSQSDNAHTDKLQNTFGTVMTKQAAVEASQSNWQNTALSMHIQSATGSPVTGVYVALVANGRIVAVTRTKSDGQTDTMYFHPPADPVISPSVRPTDALDGTVTLVAWKEGYQPVVSYEVGLPLDSSTSTRTLTMLPAQTTAAVQVLPVGSIGYPISTIEHYAQWANQKSMNALNIHVPAADSSAGTVSVHVVDQAGNPISGANVVVVAGDTMQGKSVTDTMGQSSLLSTVGISDWRLLAEEQAQAGVPVASIVVWKDGYSPAVGLYQPVYPGQTRHVTVRLQSVAWRKNQDLNEVDSPVEIPGDQTPTQGDAIRVYRWVSGQIH